MTMQLGSLLRTCLAGIVNAFVASAFFLALNAGISLRADDVPVTDAADYALVIAGVLSFLSFLSLVTLTKRGFFTGPQTGPETDQASQTALKRLLDDIWLEAALIGPIVAVFMTLAALIWRTMAAEPGISCTSWGELTNSPLPFITVFMAFCASANLGLAFFFLAVPLRENTLIAALLTLLVSLPLVMSARWFVLSRPHTRSLRQTHPGRRSKLWARRSKLWARRSKLSAPSRPSSQDGGAVIPLGSLGVLHPSERVAASLRNRNRDYPAFLIVTDQRIISVRTDRHGAVLQLAVQSPWQLAHCRSESFPGQGRVAVDFYNGSHLLIECTDPEQSRQFASALNQMAHP